MRARNRDLLKTLSFAALHFGVEFCFHERARRRVDGRAAPRKNAPGMCCALHGAG